ncbi:MAG: DNA translocase FtsK [Clostridiales bacterium]|jgi:S-DNA-T family DNA segregation ATPase FtsK/SpoIIIE|nr:DNA translocase FtsK [Clostridiales bacterium]
MARKIEPKSNKKSAPKAKTAKASPSPRSVPVRRKRRHNNGEISTLLIITFGIILCFGMYTELIGTLGSWIKIAFLSCFGTLAYVAPPLIIAVGIHIGRTKNAGRLGAKYWLTFVMMSLLSSLWHTFVFNDYRTYSAYEIAESGAGGGFMGAILSGPLAGFMGRTGTSIILTTLILIFIIEIFDFSLARAIANTRDFIDYLWNGSNDDEEGYYDDDMGANDAVSPIINDKYDPARKRKKRKGAPDDMQIGNDELVPGVLLDGNKIIASGFSTVAPIVPSSSVVDPPWNTAQTTSQEPQKPEKIKGEADEPLDELEDMQENLPSKEYELPPLSLLNPPHIKNMERHRVMLEQTAHKLLETLESFGVSVKITAVSMGPTVTRYELQPQAGVKISKIVNLSDDIALNLAASGVRIEAPIPGKAAIGIEIPNKDAETVNVSEVVSSDEFGKFPSKLAFALGSDISGMPVIVDIARMPHLLIAGSTGSGKSVCINTLITSILYKARPEEVKMILIDPKMVELSGYNGIPHLLIPVVTDPHKAAGALAWAVKEMTNRYKQFSQNNVRDLKGYNTLMDIQKEPLMPQVVIIIDELADLMMVAPNDVEDAICRLAQMARAAGMHLVIATQRPSVDVITGIIKANIPSRISFAVSSQIDSRTILDMVGAEKLIGRGDMLYSPIGSSKPLRVQGAFVSESEVSAVVDYAKQFNVTDYDEDVAEEVNNFEITGAKSVSITGGEDDNEAGSTADELLPQAIEMAIEAGQASVAMYQRRLKIGYQRAARLIDQMEDRGIIGRFEGTKPRQILITRQQFMEMMSCNEDMA